MNLLLYSLPLLSTRQFITVFPPPSLYSSILLLYFLPPSLYSSIYYCISSPLLSTREFITLFPPPFLYSWIYYCISSPLLSTREFITVVPPPSLYSWIYYCIPSPFSLLVNLLLYSLPLLYSWMYYCIPSPLLSTLWIFYCSPSPFSLWANFLQARKLCRCSSQLPWTNIYCTGGQWREKMKWLLWKITRRGASCGGILPRWCSASSASRKSSARHAHTFNFMSVIMET